MYILTAYDITAIPTVRGLPILDGMGPRNVSVFADSRNKTVLTNSPNSMVVE